MSCDATSAYSVFELSQPTFWVITGAAFVDSINPCAIAVLLLLLSALVMMPDKRKILTVGLAFVLGLFLTYFALGLGIVGSLSMVGWGPILHKIVGVLAIVIGLANIKDFFWYGGAGFVMEVPRRWRPMMKKIISTALSPMGALSAGVVVTAFELPCTGGPYIFALGLLAQDFSWVSTGLALLYYNLIFVLPLLVILGLVYGGFATAEKFSSWKDKNIRQLHLVAGVVLIGLGVWVFLS